MVEALDVDFVTPWRRRYGDLSHVPLTAERVDALVYLVVRLGHRTFDFNEHLMGPIQQALSGLGGQVLVAQVEGVHG